MCLELRPNGDVEDSCREVMDEALKVNSMVPPEKMVVIETNSSGNETRVALSKFIVLRASWQNCAMETIKISPL